MLLPIIAESFKPERKVDCNNYGARMNMVLELITQHILCKTNTMLDENFDHLVGA